MSDGNPYLLEAPALISFSGGRTSGYLLWHILQAHGGTLPEGVKAVYCNTGKEREETLDFIDEVSRRWGVPVVWLEYRHKDGKHTFEEVTYATASRKGEPFEQVIRARNRLPAVHRRFCTIDMKIRTTHRWARQVLGWRQYTKAIGFRYDEPTRVARLQKAWLYTTGQLKETRSLFGDMIQQRGLTKLPAGERPTTPLFTARVRKQDVDDFWSNQSFDLAIPSTRGNCDGCFLKSIGNLVETFAERPDLADWWIRQERIMSAGKPAQRFHNKDYRPSYAEINEMAQGRVPLPLFRDDAAFICDHGCTD